MADPINVDPNHYSVEFENDQVRVLRIRYGPGEKSEMHDHPPAVGVGLTDCAGKFTYPDGSTEDFDLKAGSVLWSDSIEHLPESSSDAPMEIVFIEIKPQS